MHNTYYTYIDQAGNRVRVSHRDEVPDYVERYWVHYPAIRDHASGELAHTNCPRCQPRGELIDSRKTS